MEMGILLRARSLPVRKQYPPVACMIAWEYVIVVLVVVATVATAFANYGEASDGDGNVPAIDRWYEDAFILVLIIG